MGKIRSTNQSMPIAEWPIEPLVDRRLANWGRWCSGSGGSNALSLWRFASRGERAAAYGVVTSVPVDNVDARRVEATVCNPGFSVLFRGLLKAHYVGNAQPSRTCVALGLHRTAYEQRLQSATIFFANRYRGAYGETQPTVG